MTVRDDINARDPHSLNFVVWAAVPGGQLNAALGRTNFLWQRVQAETLVDHYRIGLAAGGVPPATHWGLAGAVEREEAVDYAEDQPGAADIWILTFELEQVWTSRDGIIPPGKFATSYVDDFLPNITPPNLLPIPAETAAEGRGFAYVLVPVDQVDAVRQKYRRAAGDSNAIDDEASPSGRPPATHFVGEGLVEVDAVEKVKREFPVDPGNDVSVMLLDEQRRATWSDTVGDIADGRVRFAQFLAEAGLRLIR